MSKSRRLRFNFGDIFNDHRKLCYLFVDVANFKTVKDFKLHVQSGFNIEAQIYFSDNDNVLFPDFDDIRSLIDFPDIIWVRKLENHLNSNLPENDYRASVNSSYNFQNDSVLISCSDTFNGQDEVSYTKCKKQKKTKKKHKKHSVENECEDICIINASEENTSIKASDPIHDTEINSKRSSTSKVNDVIKTDIENMIVSFDNLNKDSSDHNEIEFTQNVEGSNSYYNQNFDSAYNDLSATNFNKNVNYEGSSVIESVSLPNAIGEKTYGVNRLNDFERNNSSFNNSVLFEEGDLISNSVGEKVKRKRKRTRKRKKLELKEISCDEDDNNDRNTIKTEIVTHEACNFKQKHIRFGSDNELDGTVKNNKYLSNAVSSEVELNETSELNNRIKLNSVSVCASETEENRPSHFGVLNEVSRNMSTNIVNNATKCDKIQNGNSYQNGVLDNHSDQENKRKMLTKNWDRKGESSEMVCSELLKLKDMIKKTSYFNPPVFNRTPKVSFNSKSVVEKHSETKNSPEKNLISSNNSVVDQSVNSSSEVGNTMNDFSLKVDDIVNFKILYLSADYTPTISDTVMGRVISVTDEVVKFKILLGLDICKPLTGKFSLMKEDGGEDCDIVELRMEDLISPKKIINPFSVLNQ